LTGEWIMAYKNKERKSANTSLILMIIGILAAALPTLLKADMNRWGFGVSFMGGMLAVTTFFVFLMFNGRAKVRDRMFGQQNILAHWQYSKEFWDQITKEDQKDSGVGKVFGFVFFGIFTLIGIIVFVTDPEENGVFLLIMLGIGVFFILIGFLSVRAEKKRISESLPEAIIAQEGLFYKNTLYTWNSKNIAYLESVSFHPQEPSTLLFALRQLSGGRGTVRYHPFSISIPIPPGQEQTAINIIRYFNMPIPVQVVTDQENT
jgi:DNA-binding transcriptional regulator of glucitol operon